MSRHSTCTTLMSFDNDHANRTAFSAITLHRSRGMRTTGGRFLEHSRIFHFANGKESPVDGDFFIGSADWMYRNLSKRIEVVTPALAPGPKERLWEVLDICLRDRRQAWILGNDGTYSRLAPDDDSEGPEGVGTHQTLMDLTRSRAGARLCFKRRGLQVRRGPGPKPCFAELSTCF